MLGGFLDRVTPGCLHTVSTAARVWIILQDFESDKKLTFVVFWRRLKFKFVHFNVSPYIFQFNNW